VGQDGLYISGASHRRGLDHGLALELPGGFMMENHGKTMGKW